VGEITTMSAELPTQYTHSIKIEQSAYGARVSVHVNANNAIDAMEQAVQLYRAVRLQLETDKEIVAPIEIKKANGIKGVEA
jgi:hypothetical protein